MKTAYLFMGQGFQYEGMLKELHQSYFIEEASNILKEDVLKLDTKEALENNRNVQLCIYISEVILGKSENFMPNYVAGQSIGAFAAATISGALEFSDGLRLVEARGKAMEKIYPVGYGMMAVNGLTLEALENALREFKNQVYIANINEKEQMVLSGTILKLKQVEKYLRSRYLVNTLFINVKVPSHCELMETVSHILAEKMEKIALKPPRIAYIMNTTARKTMQEDMIKKDLIFGVSKPVLWQDSLSILYELGTRKFLEIGKYREIKWRRSK